MIMSEEKKVEAVLYKNLLEGTDKYLMNYDKDIVPVSLEEFLYSKDYLGLNIKLSLGQFDVLKNADSVDASSNKYTEFVLQWGKRGGKDTVVTLLFARTVYLLLCLANPHKKWGILETDSIDLLNVAIAADQAKEIFFNRFSEIVRRAGYKTYRQFGFNPDRDIYTKKIVFPKKIIAYSGHSREQSQEGKNYFLAVMDECAGFSPEIKAEGLYKVLKSTINATFSKAGKLVLISYPRYEGDFIQRKYNEGLTREEVYTSFGATWDFNPITSKEQFKKDYDRNPQVAAAMYECQPTFSAEAYIKDIEAIQDIIKDTSIKNPIDDMGRYKEWFKPDPYKSYNYCIHIDLGLGKVDETGMSTSDAAGLAMGHLDDTGMVIIDLMKRYVAPPDKEVNFSKIREDIIELRDIRGFNIAKITIDGFQSIDTIQILRGLGFNIDLLSIDRNLIPYDTLKEKINLRKIKTYPDFTYIINGVKIDNVLIYELERLIMINGKKVDHREYSSKDISDSVAGVVYDLTTIPDATGGFKWVPIR